MNEYNTIHNPYVMNMLGFGNQGGNINLGNGYNNMSYYSGNYNCYNPYLIQQQQQAIQEQMMQEQQQIMRMNNTIDEVARVVSGRPLEQYEEYIPSEEERLEQYQNYMAIQDMNMLNNINNEQHTHKNTKFVLHAMSFNNNLDKAQKEMPNDMSTLDMLKALSNKSIEYANKDLHKYQAQKAYNSNKYNQLLQNSGNGYFNDTFSKINDISGNVVSNEYLEKKKKFMAAIFKQTY